MDPTLKKYTLLARMISPAPPPPSSMIVAASRMLIYLQSLQGRPVQNSEIKFYKGFFRKKRKKKEISNRSIKKENII